MSLVLIQQKEVEEFRLAVDLQLCVEVLTVVLYRAEGDAKTLGDALRRVAQHDQPGDLLLAVAEDIAGEIVQQVELGRVGVTLQVQAAAEPELLDHRLQYWKQGVDPLCQLPRIDTLAVAVKTER